VLHGFVPNEGVAWQYTLDTLGRYDNHEVLARVEHLPEVVVAVATDVDRFDLPVGV
jgi:hypothetical protein